MRMLAFCFATIALIGVAGVNNALAQHHHHGHHQKDGSPESAPAPPQGQPESAGFAAPPPSGTREGATGGVGINGLSIELPAMSLKLPTIRIPGLTRFTTPPHMRIKDTIAPLVDAARQEFSFESGTPPGQSESAPAPPGSPESAPFGPGQKETQKTFQKASYDDCPECQRELQQLARVHLDNTPANNGAADNSPADNSPADSALEQRLSKLESSIGRLVDGLEAAQARTVQQRPENNYLQPFPAVTVGEGFPVSRSSFERVERLPPRLLPAHVQRLPRVR